MAGEQPVHRTQAVLQSLYIDGKRGLCLGAVLLALVLPALVQPELQALLRYDRNALAGGQWWRWVTCHLVHLDFVQEFVDRSGRCLIRWHARQDRLGRTPQPGFCRLFRHPRGLRGGRRGARVTHGNFPGTNNPPRALF